MSVALAILLSALAMTAIVGVRYLLASGGFAFATRLRQPGLYQGLDRQIVKEIRWSLISAAIYGIPAGVVAWGWQNRGWTRIYTDVHDRPLWWLPLSVLLYLFAHDTWFYWSHRWMHRPRVFRVAHAVHHASRPPTAWAAMAFHPIEALTGAFVIPLLVFLIPIHVGALGVVLTVMTVMGVTNHMGWEIFPRAVWAGPLGGWLITASHHQRHHQRYGCNFGLYFRFWDRLCGTDDGLGSFGKNRNDQAGVRNSDTVRLGRSGTGAADGSHADHRA
ncbi:MULTISPECIES: sterol desaturase family protein [Sphingomonas]|uniref:Sterol desaturase family protein n=1 Tax=Sphingomonas molluscorum TaxID=418184 RepID=A0ABU8Q0L6_9SPHN|nr:sterol desaturase family protein [Sphingomonas sp. JUb134]MBM7404793.1 sterol desaturase/sphingolipid hydroxylase (fatty acid hydroxylase superfamily) [Sphingomonas sp. JUb134]